MILNSCGPRESITEKHRDADSPAGKVGQAAQKMSVEVDKAGRVVGRKLERAAHDAREGWRESERKEKSK